MTFANDVELVEAPNDDVEAGLPLVARRIFRVVAPSDLPKGFLLTVVTEAKHEEVVVVVPPGGVRRMQKFEEKRHCQSPSIGPTTSLTAIQATKDLVFPAIMPKLGMDP